MGGRVLVLNATYEPINVCTVRRAVVLLLKAKAELVERGRAELHSESSTVARPVVIRLVTYVSVPRDALHLENGKPYVFKIVGEELKRTPVVTGTYNLTQQAILSGLNDGDWIATGTTSGQPLQEGIPIKEIR